MSGEKLLPENASLCARQSHPLHKYLFPTCIVLNIFLFLWSNMSMGATVYVRVTGSAFGHSLIRTFEAYHFSLVYSVQTMWASGSYILAILIATMSGLWPYTKLVGMLGLWYMRCDPGRRERALWWLEFLGKWSLIDMFVFTMMLVGFAVDISAVANVQVFVEPGLGIYLFTAAAIISMILSHFMVKLHREAVQGSCASAKEQDDGDEVPFGLRVSKLVGANHLMQRRYLAVAAVLTGAYATVLLGQVMPSFTMVYTGLVGELLENRATASFSLLANGLELSRTSTHWSAYFLMAVFLAIAFFAPLLQLVACACLWLAPQSERQQQQARMAIDVLGAWAGIDVYLVAIAAAVVEMGKLSQQVIGNKCAILDEVTGTHCFRVDAHLAGGAYILATGVALTWAAQALMVMHAAGPGPAPDLRHPDRVPLLDDALDCD